MSEDAALLEKWGKSLKADLAGFLSDIYWSQVYHDTIVNSEWLLSKAISPGGARGGIGGGYAVGYNFLYALYRILDEMRPRQILELGLGQSTRLTGEYARYFGAGHAMSVS